MSWAADYIGIPFEEEGRTRAGLNCYGLCKLIYLEVLHIALPEYGFAVDTLDPAACAAEIAAHIGEVEEVTEPRDFDFVMMHRLWRMRPHHIGLAVEPGRVLHVARGETSVCCNRTRWRLGYNIEGFYRLTRPGGAPCTA